MTFEARAAQSEAELPDELYQEVGVAQAAPVNTELCPLGGTTPGCPPDLTGELWGSPNANQPSFLELRATLTPDGESAPTLRSWKVTYSCVYDE